MYPSRRLLINDNFVSRTKRAIEIVVITYIAIDSLCLIELSLNLRNI